MTTTTPARGNPPPVQADEFAARRMKAAKLAEERGLDGLIVWGNSSIDSFHEVYYFTNHVSAFPWVPPCPPLVTGCEHAGLLITADGRSILLASNYVRDEVYADQVRTNWNLRDELLACVGDLGLGESRLGVIGETLPYSFGSALERQFSRLRLEEADDISVELRLRLSATEIDLLRHAGSVGARILEASREAAIEGATEGDFAGAAAAEAALVPGCVHWKVMAASGPFVDRFVFDALPCWNPEYVYVQGDPTHSDLFGFVNGYPYDLARSWVIGSDPTPEQERVQEGARELCWTMARALRRGITVRELHLAGMEFLRESGLQTPLAFGINEGEEAGPDDGPGFGHALGCGFVAPYLVPQPPWADRPLDPPIGLALETFLTDGKGNYAAYEDMFVWLEDGVECISA